MASLFYLLIAFLTFTTASAQDKPACNADDKATLLKIKAAVGNPDVLSSWTSYSDCCRDQWNGVSCNPNGRVIGFSIRESEDVSFPNPVTGRFPDEVGDLPYLEDLSFYFLPGLSGPITAGVAKLRRLRDISITNVPLSGRIPSFLGEIKTLERVFFYRNDFSGTIPASLAALPNLKVLQIEHSRLTGPIPDVAGGFPKLESIFLSNNRLTGTLPQSFRSPNLASVHLSNNRLTGDALPLFDASRPMSEVSISGNSFSFDFGKAGIPATLTFLDMSHSKIYGRIPAGVKKLQTLSYASFNVSYNRLCGKVPGGKWRELLDATSFSHNLCLCGAYDLPSCVNNIHPAAATS